MIMIEDKFYTDKKGVVISYLSMIKDGTLVW